MRRIKPSPTELIALSDFIQKEFEKNHGIKPQQVIPIGIDPDEFPQENISRDIDVMGAGSLIPLKRYDIFVDIISGLKQDMPGIKAVICGKGPEENKLMQLINEKGLTGNLLLAGESPHADILEQMKRSKLFLHTSNYEGFGAVCIEALYAGMPVISFCKPMNEAIQNWHIVTTKEEMVKKAIDILQGPSFTNNPVLPFTMKEMVEKMMQLFCQ